MVSSSHASVCGSLSLERFSELRAEKGRGTAPPGCAAGEGPRHGRGVGVQCGRRAFALLMDQYRSTGAQSLLCNFDIPKTLANNILLRNEFGSNGM